MKKLLLLPLLLGSILSIAQTIGERLTTYQSQYPLEKIYIAHDRPYYAPGDTIWCEAYLVEGRSHLAFDTSPVVYVDWYNEQEECVRSFILKITDGTAAFEIPTRVEDTTGVYQLRAYTQYQRNFDPAFLFQKSILLTDSGLPSGKKMEEGSDFSIQFFPEGGYSVVGCTGKVAFKALNEAGEAIEVSGILRTTDGQTLAAIKTIHEGIGVFPFQPVAGQTYEVVATYQGKEKRFTLPAALNEGYELSVNNRGDDFFEVSMEAAPGLTVEDLQIVGHLRGLVFLDKKIEGGREYKLRIPRDQVPSGIIQLTLFDQKDRPVAERLIFNRNPNEEVEVVMEKNKEVFGTKSKVELKINAQLKALTQTGKFSMSVYNSSLVIPQKLSGNIQNYLWIQSDLVDHLPDIHQYLQENTSKTRVLLDYVLMTHGWRRFKWQEVLENVPPISFLPQEHIAIAGKVTKGTREEPIKADVFLNILSQENFASLNLTTEEDGLFIFQGFDFMDTTEVVIQGNLYNPKKKNKLDAGEAKRTGNKDVDIELLDINEIPYTPRLEDLPFFTKVEETEYAEAVENIRTVNEAYSGLIQADIDEVTVEASRLSTKQEEEQKLKNLYRSRGLVYSPTSKKLLMDNLADKGQQYPDMFELVQARFPGLIIDRTEPFNKKVFMTNVNIRITQDVQPALLVIDGLIINQSAGLTPPPILPVDVLSVDVVSPVQASVIYGEQGIGGAVVILTREDRVALGDQSDRQNKGTISLSHPGYYAAREFYKPDYSLPTKASAKPDLRTTIYWNPKVVLNGEGGTVSFYTGDQSGMYTIQIEGITENGIPFVKWEEFEVKAQ